VTPFGELDDDQRLLDAIATPRELTAGETLFTQGDPADAAVWVRSGRLELALAAPGRPQPVDVAVATAGDLLGEPALLARATRSRSARATETTSVSLLHRSDLHSLVSSFHPGSMRILLAVGRRMARRLQLQATPRPVGPPLATRVGVTPSSLDPRPYLPRLPFFAAFTAADIDRLLALGTLHDVARGTELVRAGEASRHCWLVVRGAVEVRVHGVRVGLVGPGSPVGELAPLTGGPTAADLRVRERGTLLELSPGAFEALTTPSERVAFKFTAALVRAIARSQARTNRTTARQALVAGAAPPEASHG